MSIDTLAALAPPPERPLAARADRATSEQVLGYSIPGSAWDVIERWGEAEASLVARAEARAWRACSSRAAER